MTAPAAGLQVMVFQTVTGRIVNNDLPVVGIPSFERQINQPGSISISILVGDPSVPDSATLRSFLTPLRYSLAIVYGTYIAQAGPIMSNTFDDSTGQLRVDAGGLWALLNHRAVVNPSVVLAPTKTGKYLDVSSSNDTNYTSVALHDVAAHLVADSIGRTNGALPVDIPSYVGGTLTQSYPFYSLTSLGQALQDVTQQDAGPDLDFAPYFDNANPGYIRWNARVGNPLLGGSVIPLAWDYGSSNSLLSTDTNGQNLSAGVFVKGSSSGDQSQISYAADTSLIAAGWPLTEMVDSSHSQITDPTALQGVANADISLYKRPVETWQATVRMDTPPLFGAYDPGATAVFNVLDHKWIPYGQYAQRILGFRQGQNLLEAQLILQATQGGV